MLFKIKHDVDIFELNPELRAIPEFDGVNSRQMQVVALVADYESPFRTLPEKVRREKACETAGYRLEANGRLDRNGRAVIYGEVQSIERAIKKYREIQYDHRKAMFEAIDAQIHEAIAMMTMDKMAASKVKKVTKAKDGSTSTEEYVDAEKAMKLAEGAMKLGTRLKELTETKETLLGQIQKDETFVDITTYTSADIGGEGADGMSVLDQFMEKRKLTS
jgi:5'-3' exonuclease